MLRGPDWLRTIIASDITATAMASICRVERASSNTSQASAEATTGVNSDSVNASHRGTCCSDQFMALWPRIPIPNASTASHIQCSPLGHERS